MRISQMEIGNGTIRNRRIGNNHSAFVKYISKKYKRTSEYACEGISLTYLWPKQDAGTKESNIHIAYQLMLQELYFLTHNTILVNKREILQGIAVSLERQLELVREESHVEAVRLVSLMRQMREAKDQESLLRIAHEIEKQTGGNRRSDFGRRANEAENGDKSVHQRLRDSAEYTLDVRMNTADHELTDMVKNRTAKVFEILQTMDEAQFQKMQQTLMETYEQYQLSQLVEAEERTIGIVSGQTHRQKVAYSSIIDRYFAGLQSMVVSEVPQTQKTDVRETIFEQQRNLLRRVYAESTQQEKTEFAFYLEQTELLHKTADKAVKEYENGLHNNTIEQTAGVLESRIEKETEEQRTR
ncbi:MAG: hypothetical protein K2N95_07545, partial [Lachnospiraceae bacterium]|nr:hypothetical protein [Lachnospiraceae bacterium]